MVFFLYSHHAKYFVETFFFLPCIHQTNLPDFTNNSFFQFLENKSFSFHDILIYKLSIYPILFEGLLSSPSFNCLYSKSGYIISIHILQSTTNY